MAKRPTIDRLGRLVIPKRLRERHGLHAGRALEIRSEKGRLILEPVSEEAPLVERHGVLIVSSAMEGSPIDHRSLRDERLLELAGDDE